MSDPACSPAVVPPAPLLRSRLLRRWGNIGFIGRPRFHHRFRPPHRAPQIVGAAPGSRECDRITLALLWSYTGQPPDSDLRFGLLITSHSLIAVPGRLDHGRTRGDSQRNGEVLRCEPFTRKPSVLDSQSVGDTIGHRSAGTELPGNGHAQPKIVRESPNFLEDGFRQPRPGIIAHADANGRCLLQQIPMLRHRCGVLVDHLLEPFEIRADAPCIRPRSVECRPVTLAAANCGKQNLLSLGRSRRNVEPPGAGLRCGRQAVEVRYQIRDLLIAKLLFGKGRHNTPRFSHRLPELRHAQLTAGQIRAEGAFTFEAVTIFALCGRTLPESFTRLSIAGCRSASSILSERNQK